jgi:Squalene-hopene cyclase N-terminal domain
MAEVDRLQRELLSRQNGDGGWGYQNTNSWTEPTALALLALESLGNTGAAHERGCAWLLRNQRKDGGWPPNPGVPVSTSVTTLAALALSALFRKSAAYNGAVSWMVGQIKPDPAPVSRLEFWLGRAPAAQPPGGTPWFPGTAAWVAPTATTVLALSDAGGYEQQVRRGQQFILSRRCFDAGWNHGGTKYRGERAESYPEMTGMALLVLEGTSSAELASSFRTAEKMQLSPGSSEAQSWLHLALLRHGRNSSALYPSLPWRTNRDLALRLLALTAESPGNRLRLRTS